MEIFYASMISLLFVVVSFTLHLVFYNSNAPVNGKIPPGKKGWLVIGETLEFLAAARIGHPEKFIFDRMARFSPHVFRTSLILEDVAVFCGSAGYKIFHANQQPKPEYNKMKKAFSNFFMSEALHRYAPVMDIVTKKHFENEWEDKTEVVTCELTSNLALSLACKVFVSIVEFPEVYQGVYREQTKIAHSKGFGEPLNWNDLSKMKYSWNVACEVLRGSFREAVTDFVYNDYSIPKGWKLYRSAVSTHKNPEYFPEPQKFDPTRFDGKGPAPYTFIPFGGGPHICPGKEYARVQALVFMHHLVRKFKCESFPSPGHGTSNPPLSS